jgi:mono/diheme cytochrome c family protein
VRYAITCAAVCLAFISSQAIAADVPPGKALFDRHCAECHAPGFGHPGTQQLGWTRGADRAVLEQRKDLAPAYVSAIVRNGLMEMPAFRPAEITDASLKLLAEYVASAGKKRRSR